MFFTVSIRKYMKKKYIKPCVCIDSFEVKSCILEMSYGGDASGTMESRQRTSKMADGKNDKRGYGSNGSNGSGWGSLW